MERRSKKQNGRLFLGTEFFSIGEDFLETENDRRIGNMIKLTATLYMCNTKEFSELIGDLGHGTFESMWEWYTENVTNKVKNPDIKFGNTGLIRQKYSNIDNVEDEIKKLYDGLPAIPFNNLQGFVSNTFDTRFIMELKAKDDIKDYEEISKMLNIVALSIMISCLNKDYIDMVESLIIKRSLRGIESPDRDAIVGTDYKKIEDIENKYTILNNLN